jgi:hypothetical protein
MTRQTEFVNRLVGSPAGFNISRLCALTLAALLATGGAAHGFGQAPPVTPTPTPAPSAIQKPEKKAGVPPAPKIMHGYEVHQVLELGGNIVSRDGSSAMWATMVNEASGMRVIGHSLTMHSVDKSKTPFFDTLSTNSFGYGGEPVDASYLNMSKGKWYDFAGSFRRGRNYVDYNLLVNSFLTNATASTPVLVSEPSTLHLFNTVRRNTDTVLTLLPVSRISFRAGYNHGTVEGPTYTTIHGGGDVSQTQWWRNGLDTYTAGVDAKLAKRSTLSYDQFFAFYRGNTSNRLAPTPFKLADGTPTSLGFNVLTGPTVTCGSGANKTQNVIDGIANPFCNQTIVQQQTAPTRTSFPTEQLRFSSHYWDKVAMNARFTYSGGVSNVNKFGETFNGLLSRTTLRQQIDTGGLDSSGRLAHNKRINVNADYGIEAELSKYISVSDTFNYWDVRMPGHAILVSDIWDNTPLVAGGPTPVPAATLNVNTPLSSLHNYTTTRESFGYLEHKNTGNSLVGIVNATAAIKFSGGWRFNDRQIKFSDDPTMTWHQNGVLVGLAVQPSRAYRFNMNYDSMISHSSNSETTPSNTYTRLAPNSFHHFRGRFQSNPAKWVNLSLTYNEYDAKNDDPLVNHKEHNRDFSFATQLIPLETLSVDFNYAHDSVFSRTNLCYVFTATANAPLPADAGAQNVGTCQYNTTTTPLYLETGLYDVPSDFYLAGLTYTPSKVFRFNGGVRIMGTGGQAMLLNPYNPTGAISSTTVSPFSDLSINLAPQWSWHGYWVHHGYNEDGPPGGSVPAAGGVIPSREFHGDVVTLSVKYAF